MLAPEGAGKERRGRRAAAGGVHDVAHLFVPEEGTVRGGRYTTFGEPTPDQFPRVPRSIWAVSRCTRRPTRDYRPAPRSASAADSAPFRAQSPKLVPTRRAARRSG